MPQSYAIAEINTTTLTVTRIIPTGNAAGVVALAGGRVWAPVNGLLTSLDPAQPHPQWVATGIRFGGGAMASAGEAGNTLLLQNGGPAPLAVIKVAGAKATLGATSLDEMGPNLISFFSPDGSRFYVSDSDCGRAVCGHKVSDLSRTQLFGGSAAPPAIPVGLSPDGSTLTVTSAASSSSYVLEKFNTATGKLLATAPGNNATLAALSPDNRSVFSITGGNDWGTHPPAISILTAP
jgi:DNA-binding beta-propeller fold protein YncE